MLLYVLGSNVWLGLLGGNMYCWVFYLVICVVCFRGQCVIWGLLSGNVCCSVF